MNLGAKCQLNQFQYISHNICYNIRMSATLSPRLQQTLRQTKKNQTQFIKQPLCRVSLSLQIWSSEVESRDACKIHLILFLMTIYSFSERIHWVLSLPAYRRLNSVFNTIQTTTTHPPLSTVVYHFAMAACSCSSQAICQCYSGTDNVYTCYTLFCAYLEYLTAII